MIPIKKEYFPNYAAVHNSIIKRIKNAIKEYIFNELVYYIYDISRKSWTTIEFFIDLYRC